MIFLEVAIKQAIFNTDTLSEHSMTLKFKYKAQFQLLQTDRPIQIQV